MAHLNDVITPSRAGHKNRTVTIESDDEIGALGRAIQQHAETARDYTCGWRAALNRTIEQRE